MTYRVCRDYEEDMLALQDKALDDAGAGALMRHIEACESCRSHYEWLNATSSDLEALGDTVRKNVPRVDLVDAVMRAAALSQVPTPKVVPFAPPRRRFHPQALGWASLAAAAMLVVALWISGYRVTREAEQRVARNTAEKSDSKSHSKPQGKPAQPSRQTTVPRTASIGEARTLLNKNVSVPPATESGKETDLNETQGLTMDEILALKRAAGTDEEARAQLAEWASLTDEKARRIVDDKEASLEAKIGASQALPPEEAERVLLAAVSKSPNDPFLHSELAKVYAKQPEKAAQASAQLTEASALDPENALLQYRLASSLLGQGDVEGATAALQRAQTMEQASTYTQESDAARAEALAASGISSETARLLTAFTTGMNQYVEVIQLGRELLDYGRQSQSTGDWAGAQQTYQSVQSMGAQVAAGSPQSSEQLAGLDLQASAIDLMRELFTSTGNAAGVATVNAQETDLVSAYNQLVTFFETVNAYFASGDFTDNLLRLIADFILQNGDINLLDFLSQAH